MMLHAHLRCRDTAFASLRSPCRLPVFMGPQSCNNPESSEMWCWRPASLDFVAKHLMCGYSASAKLHMCLEIVWKTSFATANLHVGLHRSHSYRHWAFGRCAQHLDCMRVHPVDGFSEPTQRSRSRRQVRRGLVVVDFSIVVTTLPARDTDKSTTWSVVATARGFAPAFESSSTGTACTTPRNPEHEFNPSSAKLSLSRLRGVLKCSSVDFKWSWLETPAAADVSFLLLFSLTGSPSL